MPRKPRTNASLADRAAKYVVTYVEVRNEYMRLKNVAKRHGASSLRASIRLARLFLLFGPNPPTLLKLRYWIAAKDASAKELQRMPEPELKLLLKLEQETVPGQAEVRAKKLLGAYEEIKRLVFDVNDRPTRFPISLSKLFRKNPPHEAQLRKWINETCEIRNSRWGDLYKGPRVVRLYARLLSSLARLPTVKKRWPQFLADASRVSGASGADIVEDELHNTLLKQDLDLLKVKNVEQFAAVIMIPKAAPNGPLDAIVNYLERLKCFGTSSTIRRHLSKKWPHPEKSWVQQKEMRRAGHR